MTNIFDLTEPIEGFTKCAVNFQIDDEHYNCDLGEIVVENEEERFVPYYTSAVIHKENIVGLEELQE
ncbi:MAG: hypothetical protein HPY57_13155 [Ignavibacteria bacterium]|nr:hypothetical protein [Ignavibacteria bacterium]